MRDLTITMPVGILQVAERAFNIEDFDDHQWEPTINGLKTIAEEVRRSGARLIVGYYPTSGQIYGPWLPPELRFKNDSNRLAAMARLRQFGAENGVMVFDYTPAIQQIVESGRLPGTSDGDYHPNDLGVAAMADMVVGMMNTPSDGGGTGG